MNILETQKKIFDMYVARGFTTESIMTLALGLCEEAGEVAKAVNYFHNPIYAPQKALPDSLEHELVDLLIYALGVANAAGIDLQTALEDEVGKYA